MFSNKKTLIVVYKDELLMNQLKKLIETNDDKEDAVIGTKDNFDTEVLQSDVPVLVDFNATWCPPCQALHPILEEMAENADDYKIVTVDIDDEEELAEKYEVSSIPCLVAFKDGEETDREIGLKPKSKLLKMVGK